MNRYVVIGLSHKTAPVELREKLSLEDPASMLAELKELADEAVVVNTCNRFEVYSYGAADTDSLLNWIAARAHLSPEDLRPNTFLRIGKNACKHLFFVASSLDSLVVGETQIRGQVKKAYQVADEAGAVGPMLHRLCQAALRVAKTIAETTGVGRGNVSVAGAAADLASRVFTELAAARVLVVGAGETAELVVNHLKGRGVQEFVIVNRSRERAEKLAALCDGQAGGFDRLEQELAHTDVIVCAAGGDEPVVTLKALRKALRRRRGRPVVAIDIAVPRGIDPRADRLDNLYRYDMDTLESVTRDALRHRRAEFLACCTLIDGAALRVAADTRAQRAGGTIAELERSYEEVAGEELERLERRLSELEESDRQRVRDSVRKIVRRLLHMPVRALRESGEHEHEVIKKVFTPKRDDDE